MTGNFSMTHNEVKQAIAEYFGSRGVRVSANDVYLSATENRDWADRPSGGYYITATVDVKLPPPSHDD